MASRFALKLSDYFSQQLFSFDTKTKKIIEQKLNLIIENPFRFPKLANYRFVFKVKLKVKDDYSRLIYAVFMPDAEYIAILGVFKRKFDYKDFERAFGRLKK